MAVKSQHYVEMVGRRRFLIFKLADGWHYLEDGGRQRLSLAYDLKREAIDAAHSTRATRKLGRNRAASTLATSLRSVQ